MTSLRTTLKSGHEMPMLGLGTWQSKPGEVEEAVYQALKCGYRHIDCAAVYGNESEVGAGLKKAFEEKICTREEVFITSKLWNTCHRPEHVRPSLEQTLKDLGLEYLDLYLMHWPISFKFHGYEAENRFPKKTDGSMDYDDVPPLVTYKAMEECVDAKLTRSIGVSNFNAEQVDTIVSNARIPCSVLQIESHPYMNNKKLIDHVMSKGVKVTAYSPLGAPTRPWAKPDDPTVLKEPKLLEMADRLKKSPAQLLIRFQLQRGVIVIPKSSSAERIKQNSEVDFELSDEDMAVLYSFERGWRACVPCIKLSDGTEIPRDEKHPFYPFSAEY